MTPEVVLLCGVGGVGKTTVAAAAGIAFALAGRRAVVITVDPARRLADALGLAVGATPTPVPLDAPGTLHAVMVDPERAFDEAIARLHPDPSGVARLREGETLAYSGTERVTVEAGNGGAVSVTVDGEPLGVPGTPGEPWSGTYTATEPAP